MKINSEQDQRCLKVSIIVPVYKVEKYLHRCVDSIIAQSFKDWELLLIDDGSPDNSGKICDEYAAKDTRIRVFHKENGGVSSARNYGLKKAQGTWITFIDSDDWVDVNFIADLYKPIESNSTLDFVQAGCVKINDVGIPIVEQKYDMYEGNDQLLLLLRIRGLVISKLFRFSILKKSSLFFDENMHVAEDMAFTIDYISKVRNYCFIPCIGYYYFQHTESVTHRKEKIDILKYKERLAEFRHLSSSLVYYCTKYRISKKDCIVRYEQIADNLFICISYLYQFQTKHDFRILRIKHDFSSKELSFLEYENSSRIKNFISSLLLKRNYAVFDFVMLSIYKIKTLINRF